MAQEIDINLNVNAQQADKSLGSLKSQLREAQAEVQTLSDKFSATSNQAIEAARAAAVLKDKIGDAKNLTDAFNPDAKFKALSASIGGVASGFAAYQGALGLAGVESKKLQEQLLQVQSAMALALGLQGLGEARDSFKQLGAVAKSVFAGIKNAIGATGIGLLVIALGAIYAYWDDIKEAVNGVSSEQKKLNQLAEKNVQIANENLKSAKSMDNTLKLQGKSEQQILDIKIKATQEAINANIKRVKGLQLTNKLEEEAAQFNYERLKSFLDFVSIPQRVLFETAAAAINKVIDLANKIPGIEIKGKIDEKFVSKATDYVTKLVFDPEKTKADGAANLKETQNAIRDLTNERDGYTNTKNKKGEKDSQKTEDKTKEHLDALASLEKKYAEDIENLGDKTEEDKLETEKQRALKELDLIKLTDAEKAKVKELLLKDFQIKEQALATSHADKLLALTNKLEDDKNALIVKSDDEKLKISQEKAMKQLELDLKNINATEQEIQNAKIKLRETFALQDAELENVKIAKEDAQWLKLQELTLEKSDYEALVRQQNFEKEYIAAEGNAELQLALKNDYLKKEEESEKANADAIKKIDEEKAKAREQWLAAGASTLKQASTLLGESTSAGKAAAVAAATIETYQAAVSSYNSLSGIPFVGPTLGAVAAGVAVASGIANVKKILAVKTPNGGGGGGAPTAAPAPSFNIVGPSGTNQIAESIGLNKESQPLKAFVVGGDVTSQQSLNRGIVQNATLG
jgi:hypothetical protein